MKSLIKDVKMLTRRELEILRYIAKGLETKQIAPILFRSVRTIETHRKNMLRKTGAKNSGELIQMMHEYLMLPPDAPGGTY